MAKLSTRAVKKRCRVIEETIWRRKFLNRELAVWRVEAMIIFAFGRQASI